MLEIFSDWAPELKNLFIECEDSFILRPIYALPLNTHWESQPGLTLLGDAAHLMSPFSGMGANLAMLDGMDLANAICDSADITNAIKIFETTMFERAHPAMSASARGLDNAIASDAPRASLERFKQHYQQQK
jgi:2-polyprenyl-6-methoxyphenol hydroxylase-like FAD-dependent oxidoreductase